MRQLGLVAIAFITACAPGQWFRRGPTPNQAIEAQYARALQYLDPASASGSVDSAITYLDAYIAHAGYVQHRREAAALRRLASDAQQLAKVELALREARASASEPRPSSEPAARTEETVREVQRLRDELAKANAELERIRKRLATPKP